MTSVATTEPSKGRDLEQNAMKPATATQSSQSSLVVELARVDLNFGDKQVLRNVSLQVHPQERVVIMGLSGAGKTSILRLMLGILRPSAGAIRFEGRDIADFDRRQLQRMRSRIGMVYQDSALLSSLTVRQNLAFPLQEWTEKSPAEINQVVDEKLEMVEMADDGDLKPHELSGGMRKRAGLARALVLDPELILFDEPTAGLDPVMSAVIDELIVDLTKRSRVTSVIVTHLMNSAFRIATRMAMLHGGEIIQDGSPEELRASNDPVVVQFLSGSTQGPMLARSKYHMLSPAD